MTMEINLTEIFDNISYESAEKIAKNYEAAAHNVDEGFQTRIYHGVMTMINAKDDKTFSVLQ